MSSPAPGTGHARNASRSSVSSAGPSEISSSGTATPSSPASATKTGAFSRAASIAKRSSVQGSKTPTRAGNSNNAGDSDTPISKPRRGASISLRRNTSSSSSATESAYEDASALGSGSNTELSRMTRDQLLALIARERTEHEELDTKLATLTADHSTLSGTHADLQNQQKLHEVKLQEAHSTASRFETELADQTETLDGLKAQLRDAEKESREAQKRYREQVETFDAERTSWQDGEKLLQSKMDKLQLEYEAVLAESHAKSVSGESAAVTPALQPETASSSRLSPSFSQQSGVQRQPHASPTFSIPVGTLDELQNLHIRVAELEAERESYSTETRKLQAELDEVQRMNGDLQEENENYEVLLGERMLAGLGSISDSGIGSGNTSTGTGNADSNASEGTRSRPGSALDRLEEESVNEDGELLEEDEDGFRRSQELFESAGDGSLASGAVAAKIPTNRTGRIPKKRDSMLGMGGGIDLEAELDRAKMEEEDRVKAEKEKERKRSIAARRKANQSTHLGGREGDPISFDVEALQKEVRLLRQENKGLTTYVGKIIERVIGVEGFERVLAADYRSSPLTQTQSKQGDTAPISVKSTVVAPAPVAKPAATVPALPPRPAPLRTQSSSSTVTNAGPLSPTGPPAPAGGKKNRLSMDWITSAIWKGSTPANATNATQPPPAGFKPMRLNAAVPAAPSARRLSIEEDEEDQKTRARLQSEMRLLGLDNHGSPVLHPPSSSKISLTRSPSRRYSGSSAGTGASPRPPSLPPKDETAAREQQMRYELENGRASGFTEMPGTSPGDAVKVRGHRKRPSATNRESIIGGNSLSSIGLGLSYSRDTSSTWSAGSPSAASLAGETDILGDKRRSESSQNSQ